MPTDDLNSLISKQCPGHSLDRDFYIEEAIYQREMETVFSDNWIFAGHESQIPSPGDYFLFELDRESVIVVRDGNNRINAFMNVCRHRGSRICLETSGSVKRFTCPYHAWSFNLDGDLLSARLMGENFDKAEYGLHRVHVDSLGGLLFVAIGRNPVSLDHARRDLQDVFSLFDLASLKVAHRQSYEIAANWKLAIENYHECYHCAPSHPEYAELHALKLDPAELETHQNRMRAKFSECGIRDIDIDFQDDLSPVGAQGYAYHRVAMFDGVQSGSKDGKPLAPLLGELKGYDGGASDLNVGPVSFFLIYSDHVVGYRFLPKDAHTCICDVYWMVRKDAQDGVDYRTDQLVWLWDVTTKADERIIVNNQKGVNSRAYRPGPFSGMEEWTRRFITWYLDQIREPDTT